MAAPASFVAERNPRGHCCRCRHASAQEPSFNPYYAALLKKLTAANKSHKITLKFCLWDHFKEVAAMEARRSANLARLTAHVLAHFCVPLVTLKAVDFTEVLLSPKETAFWQLTFRHLFLGYRSEEDVTKVFVKLAGQQSEGKLQEDMLSFLQRSFGPWCADFPAKSPAEEQRTTVALTRLRTAEKILAGAKKLRM